MLLTLSAWLFGLLRGMGHALEPDHLAAVSTLVAETPHKPRAGLLLGAAWGAGHTLMLVLVGGALFTMQGVMPPALERGFELLVAFMLVGLGLRALLRAATVTRERPHPSPGGATTPAPALGSRPRGLWRTTGRPLVIGSVHGLAGSGALTAAVVAKMPSAPAGLVYILLFGVGSAMGMALLSGAVGASCARVARGPRALSSLLVASGVLSLALGVAWGWSNALELLEPAAAAAAAPRGVARQVTPRSLFMDASSAGVNAYWSNSALDTQR